MVASFPHRSLVVVNLMADRAGPGDRSDQSHLHRQLLAHSGYTPTSWRERGHDWHVSGDRTM
jgi:hypothetical protein